jgi:hypothetical protein
MPDALPRTEQDRTAKRLWLQDRINVVLSGLLAIMFTAMICASFWAFFLINDITLITLLVGVPVTTVSAVFAFVIGRCAIKIASGTYWLDYEQDWREADEEAQP